MNWFGRGLLLLLVLGVWALVFKPSSPTAHDDNFHSCSFSWNGGYGDLDESGEVFVYSGRGNVGCSHY